MSTDKISQEEKNKSIVSGEFASEESRQNNDDRLSQTISPESGEESYFSDEDIYVEPPRNLSPGAVMKRRYELVERIGEGGMGEVWKVHDKISEQDYALKFVPQGIQNAVAMKRVKAAFNLISGLNHTNICPVRFLESDPIQGYFIVMDLLNGQTLEDLITDWEMTGGAPPEAVSAILRPVAAALDYAHNKKIIHRDIKPSNIFVNWNEETGKPSDVWIIDFGLAAVILSSITRTTGKSLGTSGTRPYMSPEQWDGSPLQNAKTDQYALGVVAYEMYSGSWPFYNSDKDLFEKFVLTKPVRLLPNVSDSINAALQKALAKKPEDRFDTCTDFIDAMEGARYVVKEEPEEVLSVEQLAERFYKELKAKQDKEEAERKAREKIEREKKEKEEKERKPGTRGLKTVNGVEFAFRWCPAGTFTMGSPEGEAGRYNDERQHRVTLSKGFWMLETEVTQRQWKAIMGNNPSYFTGDNLPVEQVSWNDCQEFCKKFNSLSGLQIGLPTEAQWEYACRAGTMRAYAGDLDSMAWYNDNSGSKTHPVGSKQPNAWGLYDMHGNVYEWCSDWYGDYPSGSVTDPTGASSGTDRVNRGGGWCSLARHCRSAKRSFNSPDIRLSYLGFRPVFVLFVP